MDFKKGDKRQIRKCDKVSIYVRTGINTNFSSLCNDDVYIILNFIIVYVRTTVYV